MSKEVKSELTPQMVHEAWIMAAHEFEHECYEGGKDYDPYPLELLYSGLTLESILEYSKAKSMEDLVLFILGWDVKTLTDLFLRAHRAGHKNYLYLWGMGHVHRSQLPQIYRTASEYLEAL